VHCSFLEIIFLIWRHQGLCTSFGEGALTLFVGKKCAIFTLLGKISYFHTFWGNIVIYLHIFLQSHLRFTIALSFLSNRCKRHFLQINFLPLYINTYFLFIVFYVGHVKVLGLIQRVQYYKFTLYYWYWCARLAMLCYSDTWAC
jgi:hypothetical protein